MRFSLLLLTIAACSTHEPIRTDDTETKSLLGEKSGTRLKVRYYVAADGSEQASGFFDSTRKENCSFRRAADSVVRCLPDDASTIATNGVHFFSDAACTQRLIAVEHGCSVAYVNDPTGPFLSNNGAQCAQTAVRILKVGQAFAGSVFYEFGGGCSSGTRLSSGTDYYGVGPEIPASSFQSATEVVR